MFDKTSWSSSANRNIYVLLSRQRQHLIIVQTRQQCAALVYMVFILDSSDHVFEGTQLGNQNKAKNRSTRKQIFFWSYDRAIYNESLQRIRQIKKITCRNLSAYFAVSISTNLFSVSVEIDCVKHVFYRFKTSM